MSDPLVTEWTSGGVPQSISTARDPGESETDWQARHTQAVRFWQGVYPPD